MPTYPHIERYLADKQRGSIKLDDKTTLTGVPPEAWRRRSARRSQQML